MCSGSRVVHAQFGSIGIDDLDASSGDDHRIDDAHVGMGSSCRAVSDLHSVCAASRVSVSDYVIGYRGVAHTI